MRTILAASLSVLGWVSDALKVTLGAALIVVVITSHWHYALVDGEEKRCFAIYLPGFIEYTDWDHGDLAIRTVFSMRAHYRIGPWLDPEWIEHPDNPNFAPDGEEDDAVNAD